MLHSYSLLILFLISPLLSMEIEDSSLHLKGTDGIQVKFSHEDLSTLNSPVLSRCKKGATIHDVPLKGHALCTLKLFITPGENRDRNILLEELHPTAITQFIYTLNYLDCSLPQAHNISLGLAFGRILGHSQPRAPLATSTKETIARLPHITNMRVRRTHQEDDADVDLLHDHMRKLRF